jgi:hypothetical protein
MNSIAHEWDDSSPTGEKPCRNVDIVAAMISDPNRYLFKADERPMNDLSPIAVEADGQ